MTEVIGVDDSAAKKAEYQAALAKFIRKRRLVCWLLGASEFVRSHSPGSSGVVMERLTAIRETIVSPLRPGPAGVSCVSRRMLYGRMRKVASTPVAGGG